MIGTFVAALVAHAFVAHALASAAHAAGAHGDLAETVVREQTLRLPIVGPSKVYVPSGHPEGAILFLSGDGGWNKGVVGMAQRSARVGRAVVAGVSLPQLQRAARTEKIACWCPACDLEEIGKSLEKQIGFPEYLPPALIGYSSGATLTYAALAAAPSETFSGGMSLGFCPDLEEVPKLCRHGDWRPAYDPQKRRAALPAVAEMSRPWVALQGTVDKVCDAAETTAFVEKIHGATLSLLPGVGHGYSNEKRWGPAFDQGVALIMAGGAAADAAGEKDTAQTDAAQEADGGGGSGGGSDADPLGKLGLPLEVKLAREQRAYFLFVSGDGGWSKLDKTLAERLAAHGISTIGLNALKYFWNAKTAEGTAADLRRVLERLHDGVPVVFGGYSFGAEVAPFLAARPELRDRPMLGLVLIAPGPFASWEVSPLDWLRSKEKPTPHKVVAQIESLGAMPVLCLYGSEDDESICPQLDGKSGRTAATLGGGHHFGGEYESIGDKAAAFIEELIARPSNASNR